MSTLIRRLSDPTSRTHGWTELSPGESDAFSVRLLTTNASLIQYFYWNESYRPYLQPVYLRLGGPDPSAYVCVLTFRLPGLRVGLIHRGPVSLTGDPISVEDLRKLREWARANQYAFLRFTHHDADLLANVREVGACEERELFPLYRDSTAGNTELIVDQKACDTEMLASFDREARRKIRRAKEAGFELKCGDNSECLSKVWGVLLRCSQRKKFTLHKPLSAYLQMVQLARKHDCVRVYSAWYDGIPIQANLVLRDRDSAFCLLAALDTDALNGKPTPAVLVHWHAMRDLYRAGNIYYNFGCAEGGVEHFKSQFCPRKLPFPEPVTLITNSGLCRLWKTLLPVTTFIGLPLRSAVECFEKKIHSFASRTPKHVRPQAISDTLKASEAFPSADVVEKI